MATANQIKAGAAILLTLASFSASTGFSLFSTNLLGAILGFVLSGGLYFLGLSAIYINPASVSNLQEKKVMSAIDAFVAEVGAYSGDITPLIPTIEQELSKALGGASVKIDLPTAAPVAPKA